MKKFAKVIGLLFLALVVVLMTAWGVCAIYWAEPPTGLLQTVLAAGFGLATALAFLCLPNRRRTLVGFLLVFAGVVAWWMSIPASNDRPWQRDVAALPYATVQGDQVTIHNIRNLNYRTETDFDVRYYDRTFDLAPAGLGRPDRGLLDGGCDRPRHDHVRVPGKGLRDLLDRDPQGDRGGVLDAQGGSSSSTS